MDFNFTTRPIQAWIEIIFLAANNLFGFILTNGFGDEYIVLEFRCKDVIASFIQNLLIA